MIGRATIKPIAICTKLNGTSTSAAAVGYPSANCSYMKYPNTISSPPTKTDKEARKVMLGMSFLSLRLRNPTMVPSIPLIIRVPGAKR